MSTYWTADLHLGYENIIRHCNRPFSDADEMNQALVDGWNDVVEDSDSVYCLGDLTYKAAEDIEEVLGELKGSITLITGNHDVSPHRTKGQGINFNRFQDVTPYKEIEIDGQQLIMFHYAIENWNNKWGGKSWHLHGHSHGKAKKMKGRLDVGVDTHDFRPWSWKEIKQHFGRVEAF